MRNIIYLSGTRADFGLMNSTLRQAAASNGLDVSVCVTGMHLLPEYGMTVREVEAAGLRICGRVPVQLGGNSGAEIARAVGTEVFGLVEIFQRERPDALLLLGDRGEMLAGAIAAIHLNIPIIHIHGGELSGTVDEPIRHAISKLAHYHCTSTEGARERLIRMGERRDNIFVTGAPGLDGLLHESRCTRIELCQQIALDPSRAVALVVFHPVVQEAEDAGCQMRAILAAIHDRQIQALCLKPNADAGGHRIRESLEECQDANIRVLTHLGRENFVSWLAAADVMVGNSSAGIIEAATFGLPVVNVGSRQDGRERSGNVLDVRANEDAVAHAIRAALAAGRYSCANVYGDGRAGQRIIRLLQTLPLTQELLKKQNAY